MAARRCLRQRRGPRPRRRGRGAAGRRRGRSLRRAGRRNRRVSRASTDNREHALRALRNHQRAAEGVREGYEDLPHPPMPFDADMCPDAALARAARAAWVRALTLGTAHGFRNAQTTMIAPPAGRRAHPRLRGVRHRARLGRDQVRAAARRRLPQDRQTATSRRRSPGSATRRRDRRHWSRTSRGTARSTARPASTIARLRARGFTIGRAAGTGGRDRRRARHTLRLQPLDAGRRVLHARPRASRARPRRLHVRHAEGARLLRGRDRSRPTRGVAAPRRWRARRTSTRPISPSSTRRARRAPASARSPGRRRCA